MSKKTQVARGKQVGRAFWKNFNCLRCSPQGRDGSIEEEDGNSDLSMTWTPRAVRRNSYSSREFEYYGRETEPPQINREANSAGQPFEPWYQPLPDESAEIARQPKQSSPKKMGHPRESFPVSPIELEDEESRFFVYPHYRAEDIMPELRQGAPGNTQSRQPPRASYVPTHPDAYSPQQSYPRGDRRSASRGEEFFL